jgi:hypothetical protein
MRALIFMDTIKMQRLRNFLYPLLKQYTYLRQTISWQQRNFASPAPEYVKRKTLLRNQFHNLPWIETGTYKGDTTTFLAVNSPGVFTIEPSEKYYLQALARFANNSKVQVIQGSSEEILEDLIVSLKSGLNFWLDGHFSGGETFLGSSLTPIITELKIIDKIFNQTDFKFMVAVDDIRLFKGSTSHESGYPELKSLVDWAEENNYQWHIEHDIFFAIRNLNS